MASRRGFPRRYNEGVSTAKCLVERCVFARGTVDDPLLAKHASLTHVLRLRVHDPSGLTFFECLITANKKRGEDKAPVPFLRDKLPVKRLKLTAGCLRRWLRAARRIDPGEPVSYSAIATPRPLLSIQSIMFAGQLFKERTGIVGHEPSDESDQLRWDLELTKLEAWAGEQSELFQATHESVAVSFDAMTQALANEIARHLLETEPSFREKSQREWAEAIECSVGLVAKLPVWQAVMEKSGRGRKGKPTKLPEPRAVEITDKVQAKAGYTDDPADGADREAAMQALLREATPAEQATFHAKSDEEQRELTRTYSQQAADAEPSPLDPDPLGAPPIRIRDFKRL